MGRHGSGEGCEMGGVRWEHGLYGSLFRVVQDVVNTREMNATAGVGKGPESSCQWAGQVLGSRRPKTGLHAPQVTTTADRRGFEGAEPPERGRPEGRE